MSEAPSEPVESVQPSRTQGTLLPSISQAEGIGIRKLQSVTGGGGRNRTGVHGFAGRCITTLPPRRDCCVGEDLRRESTTQTKRESYCAFPGKLEREKSLELSTSTLARLRSTN